MALVLDPLAVAWIFFVQRNFSQKLANGAIHPYKSQYVLKRFSLVMLPFFFVFDRSWAQVIFLRLFVFAEWVSVFLSL